MLRYRIFRYSPLTFKVTWVKAGTSSVFGLESLRELRVQGAVGIGNGFGPSLTHGGRKVVLCGGWPPAPGIFAQRSFYDRGWFCSCSLKNASISSGWWSRSLVLTDYSSFTGHDNPHYSLMMILSRTCAMRY